MQLLAAFALLVLSSLITALITPKARSQDPKPNVLGDFDFPQFEDGTPQTVVFGDVWMSDQFILFYGDLSSQAIKAKSSGKK